MSMIKVSDGSMCLNGECKAPVQQSQWQSSPQIPYKPHYLRYEYAYTAMPPLPPRIKNKEAVLQRRQLQEEYFENIRRSVDISEKNFEGPQNLVSPLHSSLLNSNGTSNALSEDSSNTSHLPTMTDSLQTCYSSNLHLHAFVLASRDGKSRAVTDRSNSLMHNLKSLKHCGWYWGNMTWKQAEALLGQNPGKPGLFLVRDSQDPCHILTLSVLADRETVRHVRIEYSYGKFQLYDPDRGSTQAAAGSVRHSNIITFISLAMMHSKNGTFLYFVRPRSMGEAPAQIQLLQPVSRFSCVKSLRYYCRFAIRSNVALENVARLPLPLELKQYLTKSHYFDQNEDLQCAHT